VHCCSLTFDCNDQGRAHVATPASLASTVHGKSTWSACCRQDEWQDVLSRVNANAPVTSNRGSRGNGATCWLNTSLPFTCRQQADHV